jgi:hypothetical protein
VLAGARCVLERGIPVVAEVAPKHDELRGGHLDQTLALFEAHYTHFLDLRLRWPDKPPLRPTSELRALAGEYAGGFTDVLAVNLAR